jgi:DNA polymerase-1
MAKRLITIRCDVDLSRVLPAGLINLVRQTEDKVFLLAQFKQFGFRTWTQEIEARLQGASIATGEKKPILEDLFATAPLMVSPYPDAPGLVKYETITTLTQLTQWIAKLEQATLTSLDTETTSLDPMLARIVGISVATEQGQAAYIPLAHRYAETQSSQHAKLGQNIKYDQHVFANHGITLRGIKQDTLLQSYVLSSHERHNMDALSARHLGIKTISYEAIAGKGAKQIGFDEIDVATASHYAAEDADITLRLNECLLPQIQAQSGLCYVYESIEMPARECLFVMERNGVLIDAAMLRSQSQTLGERLIALEKEAFDLAGQPFNMGSPKQVGDILFGKLMLPVIKKTPKGAPSTDEDVLQQLALDYPLPKKLLEHRSLSKLKSTYTDKLPQMINAETGRVHTNYAQAVAVTGRLASSEPNLQNIPVRTTEGRRIREAFIAPKGSQIISADYSQIELRIMAHLSQDQGLLVAFARGDDIHRATAAEIFGISQEEVSNEQRRYAKTINFGLIYGMSAFGLAAQLEIERSAAKIYIDRYFSRYPGVAIYMEETRQLARKQGYVETVFGRRLWLPEITSSNAMRRQGAERAAINAPMQGTAADLIKLAMIAVQAWLEKEALQSKLIMQVHDELVLEVVDAERDLVQTQLPLLMQHVAKLSVPLVVDVGVGNNWEEAH